MEGGWYPDPLGAAELRWFDGTVWTWHVATAGRAWTAPFGDVIAKPPEGHAAGGAIGQAGAAPPPPRGDRDVLAADDLVVGRPAQPRGNGARLDVYDGGGNLGHFTETTPDELNGASVVRLTDTAGAPLLSIVHPGRGARARVDGPAGPLGFVSRVGRVRANLELHGPGRSPDGPALAVLRPLEDSEGWEWRDGDGRPLARLRWWRLTEPSDRSYGEARYTVHVGAEIDAGVRALLLALPVVVDRALVQLVSPG